MSKTKKKNDWQQNKWAWLATGLVSGALSYVFISLAINSGSYWHYAASILLFWLAVKFSIQAVKLHGKN